MGYLTILYRKNRNYGEKLANVLLILVVLLMSAYLILLTRKAKHQNRPIAIEAQESAIVVAPIGVTPTQLPIGYSGNPVTGNSQWEPVIETFDGVEMVLVPAGCFQMGNDPAGRYWNGNFGGYFIGVPDGGRQCFKEPFWIDRYEVTNEQFTRLGGEAVSDSRWTEPDRPRERITWFEARDYCEKRGGTPANRS